MNIYDYELEKRDGRKLSLSSLKGKTLLIVNTATGCGFTPQYKALEELYQKYHDKGLEIIDLPCDQFGHQAPGTNDEIHDFCTAKYNTSFDQLNKIEVNGENVIPLYKYLKSNSPSEYIKGMKNKFAMKAVMKLSKTCTEPNDIKWNFTKFLVSPDGEVIMRVSPIESPLVMEDRIKSLLGE